jgi:hypothetical protein
MKKMSKNNELHSQKLNCCDKYKLGGVIRYLIHIKRYLKSLFQTFLKQAYRLGQRVILPVGGCFIYKSRTKHQPEIESSANNKKTKKENTFARSKNLTMKRKYMLFSNSFQRQIYRFGQLAIPQVGGCFIYKSRTKHQPEIESSARNRIIS